MRPVQGAQLKDSKTRIVKPVLKQLQGSDMWNHWKDQTEELQTQTMSDVSVCNLHCLFTSTLNVDIIAKGKKR